MRSRPRPRPHAGGEGGWFSLARAATHALFLRSRPPQAVAHLQQGQPSALPAARTSLFSPRGKGEAKRSGGPGTQTERSWASQEEGWRARDGFVFRFGKTGRVVSAFCGRPKGPWTACAPRHSPEEQVTGGGGLYSAACSDFAVWLWQSIGLFMTKRLML